MQPVIFADLDTIMPRTINQPLIAETNLSANNAEQNRWSTMLYKTVG